MLKIVLGIIAGIVAAFATVYVLELLAHQLFPGVDVTSPSVVIPLGMQIFIIVAYFIATFVGALVGGRIAHRRWAAWAVAAVVTASAIATIFMVDQPLLMDIVGVIAPLLGGYVAARMVREGTVATSDGGTADAAM